MMEPVMPKPKLMLRMMPKLKPKLMPLLLIPALVLALMLALMLAVALALASMSVSVGHLERSMLMVAALRSGSMLDEQANLPWPLQQ